MPHYLYGNPHLCYLLLGCYVPYHGESVENIWNSPFHGRLLFRINISMRTLLCTALLPAPCACAAAVRSSIAISTTAADLNAVCFVSQKKANTAFFFFCLHKTEFSMLWSGVFQQSGIFRSCPLLFCCQRLSVKALPWRCLSRGESAVSRHICPNLGFVDPARPGENKVTSRHHNPSIHLRLQQTGDETSGSPGRHRTARCGHPSSTSSLLNLNLEFVGLARPGEDKVPSCLLYTSPSPRD